MVNLIMVSYNNFFHGMLFRSLRHLVRRRSSRYHGMSIVVLVGLELLEGFDVGVPGRDEPFRVGLHEGIRVVLFVLQQSPCFGSFGFGTPHDAELESWWFWNWGFLD